MRVLVADPDAGLREAIRRALAEHGHEVVPAATGADAVQEFHRRSFDMVILDRELAEPGTLELCATIREQAHAHYAFTMIASARSDADDDLACLAAGADEYVRKPLRVAEVVLRVETAGRRLSLGSRHIAVFALARLAESRDPDTGQHLERIRSYSWLLARRLAVAMPELGGAFLDDIYHTSPLHDIGKVGIPDFILLKPDRLTDGEFEVMRSHTVIGAQTLDAALREYPQASYLTMARDIALSHHENFDGSGYPHGIAGTDIPVSGRIVSLADTYDALTSQRPYKRAFEHPMAKGIILQQHKRFDPAVLAAFLDLEDEFVAIGEAMRD